jgi:hypothetical protein
MRRLLAAVLVAFAVVPAACCAAGTNQSTIRVTLTAKNHHPRPSESPSWHWWYCVKVRTAAGKSVAATIHLQILSGRTTVERVGSVVLKKGYDHWCAAIGGRRQPTRRIAAREDAQLRGGGEGEGRDCQAELADRGAMTARRLTGASARGKLAENE